MKKQINEIIFRNDVYPRFEPDQNKIQEYSENIERLPPIIINQDNILIDGWHRIKAHKQAKVDVIDVVVEKTSSDNELYLRAIELNATHGLQLSYKDKQSIAVKLYDGKNQDRLIKALSVSERTLRGWTSNKRKAMEEERNERIISLYLKCLTQQQIADDVGVNIERVNTLIKNFEIGKIAEIKNFTPFLYNVWNINNIKNNTLHFGNFPVEFMENLLYYYTKPFDVVYDPFVGGGVTIDTCKKWFRRYYVSDLNPIPAREEDIKKWDINEGLPEDLPKCNFVFLDPPYWKQAEGKYSNDKEDLANMSLIDFYDTIMKFMKQMKKKLTNDGRVALIISATQWKNKDHSRTDHAVDLIEIFKKLGFVVEERIICPYSTEQYNGTQVNIAKDEKIMLNTYRDLIIFKKEEQIEQS